MTDTAPCGTEAASRAFLVRLLLALLPLGALCAAIWGFRRRRWAPPAAVLAGGVVWVAVLVVITEALSGITALRPVPLSLSWGVGLLALTLVAAGHGRRPATDDGTATEGLSPGDITLALLVAGVLTTSLGIALVAAPNNWDSMVYHLPRIRHWMLNETVAHFPTHNLHEVYFPPLAEWIGLHLQILTTGDRLANLVQWLAFAGIVIGVAAVAGELGAGRRGRLVAAVFAATLPMAILQASSTQNDLVVSLWTVAFVLFALRSRRLEGKVDLLLSGASLGLLLLTKLTAAVIVFPFLLWWVVPRLRRGPHRLVLAASLALAALLYAGHGLRNTRLFLNPIAPVGQAGVGRFTNPAPRAATVLSNLLRNGAVLAAGPGGAWNHGVESITASIHGWLELESRAPIETFDDRPFELSDHWLHESSAGAPTHLLVVGLAAAGWALASDLRRHRRLVAYGICLAAGFVLFAAVFRWQSGNARLLLPALVLGAPWAARAITEGPWRRAVFPVALLLMATAVPPLLANEIRPLVGRSSILSAPRSQQLFASRPWEEMHLRFLLHQIRDAGCDRVSLITTDASYEYPVWTLLDGISPQGPEIRHVRVWNPSRMSRPRWPEFDPCAVLHLFGGIREAELYWPRARRRTP